MPLTCGCTLGGTSTRHDTRYLLREAAHGLRGRRCFGEAGKPGLTRSEKLLLATAALRGTLAGAARAIISWLIEQHTH